MFTVFVDFNSRLADGSYPTILDRGLLKIGDRVHACDGEGSCAEMDVVALRNPVAGDNQARKIVLYLDMLTWHSPSCKKIEEMLPV